jgi:hypothetical protein
VRCALATSEGVVAHALKLRVLLLILPVWTGLPDPSRRVDNNEHNLVQKVMSPGWVKRANSVKAVQQFW